MSKSAARLALACAVVGLGASMAAAYVHYHLLVDPTYTSFCDVNTTVSCTQVYLSPYSTFRGVPVAVFGAIWFAGVALLALSGLVAPERARESAPGINSPPDGRAAVVRNEYLVRCPEGCVCSA
jgi:uncharacterized membrane protein